MIAVPSTIPNLGISTESTEVGREEMINPVAVG